MSSSAQPDDSAKEENILEKEYKRDLIGNVTKNRGLYVSAALTILQAFLIEKPVVDVKPLSGFNQWSGLVRNALIWLGEVDPVPTSSEIYALDGIDEERAVLGNLLHAWYSANGKTAMTGQEVIASASGEYGNPALKAALTDCALDRFGQISAKSLGYYLRANADVRVNDMRFIKARTDRRGLICWQIELFEHEQSPSDERIYVT